MSSSVYCLKLETLKNLWLSLMCMCMSVCYKGNSWSFDGYCCFVLWICWCTERSQKNMTWRARFARRESGGFCAMLVSGSKPRRSSRRVSDFPLAHAAGSFLELRTLRLVRVLNCKTPINNDPMLTLKLERRLCSLPCAGEVMLL